MYSLLISGFLKQSFIDYPNKISAVVFLHGCNFRCNFCHNKYLILGDPTKMKIEKEYILGQLNKYRGWLEAVVISGGEPTLSESLPEFIKEIKNLGFLVKLDTNGTNPRMIKELINEKLIDYVAMDVKTSFENYDKVTKTKTNINKIRQTIKILKNSGIDYEFRTTLVPKIVKKEDLMKIFKELKGSKNYYLQQFKQDIELMDNSIKGEPYSEEQIKEFAKLAREYFNKVGIRNI